MSVSSTISVQKISEEIREVKFSNLPVNLISPETVTSLHQVVIEISQQEEVKVVLFSSGVADYFFNHFDLARAADFPLLPGSDGIPVWTDLVIKLTKAPFISIATIRGRTRGGGNELALALDLRYASRELAFFGQPEVGTGILAGGGGTERLPRLIGRDRALEVILSSDDYDADTAERFGWVTRALPDVELDGFVTNLAKRLASFDKQSLYAAKQQINRASLPPEEDLFQAYWEYSDSLSWKGFQARMPKFGERMAQYGIDEVERRLGHYIGASGQQA